MAEGNEDDAEFIRAARNDPASFGVVFDRHFSTVYRFCGRRVGRDLAEDLAGETFRRAFEARHAYDLSQSNALPWLIRIALNLVRDTIRTRAAEDRAYSRLQALAGVRGRSEEDQVARSAEARAELAHFAHLLLAESTEDVDALFLHVWDGLSYAEVATALGISDGTVRSRLSRLRHRLGTALGQQADESQVMDLKAKE